MLPLDLAGLALVERLGWTLVHSTWQCASVAIMLALMLLLSRRAGVRYAVSCAAMFLSILTPFVTFFWLSMAPHPALIAPSETGAAMVEAIPAAPGDPISDSPISVSQVVPWAALVWLGGVVFLSLRHIAGWMSIQTLRHDAVPLQSRYARVTLQRLRERLQITRAVRLMQSADVCIPSVVGFFKPMILLPVSAICELSAEHLEAVIAHELAHIRRQDYLINLIQIAVETLLFYHPAVWWISRVIRQEREHCCDDLAVGVLGDAHAYSAALAAVEELRAAHRLQMVALNGGSLMKRIQRLLKPEPRRVSLVWPALLLLAMVAGILAMSQMSASRAQAQDKLADSVLPPTTAPAAAEPGAPTVEAIPAAGENTQSSNVANLRNQLDAVRIADTQARAQAEAIQAQRDTDRRRGPQARAAAPAVELWNNPLVAQPAQPAEPTITERMAVRRSNTEAALLEVRLASVQAQMADAEAQLKLTEQQFGPQHPAVAQSRAQMEQLRTQAQLAERQLAAAKAVQEADAPLAQRELRDLYDQAVADVRSGNLDMARTRFDQLRAANYRGGLFQRSPADYLKEINQQMAAAPQAQEVAPAGSNTYYISGVIKPGMYSIPEHGTMNLRQAVNLAGGLLPGSYGKYIQIVRNQSNEQRTFFVQVNDFVAHPENVKPVRAGDVIMLTTESRASVPSEGTYRISGSVPKPGEFPLVKNMTLLQALVAAGVNPPDQLNSLVYVKSQNYKPGSSNSSAGAYAMGDILSGRIGSEPIGSDAEIRITAQGEKSAPNSEPLAAPSSSPAAAP